MRRLGETGCRTITANDTLLDTDEVVIGDTSGGAVTLTMTPVQGKVIWFKRVGGSDFILDASGMTQQFDGSDATKTLGEREAWAFRIDASRIHILNQYRG